MSKYGEFTCEQCYRTFDKSRSDEEAFASDCKDIPELASMSKADCATVCDDCYKAMLWPEKYPLLVEKAHFERAANAPKD